MSKKLKGRLLEIAEGRSDLPVSVVEDYRRLWKSQGYDLPPYTGEQIRGAGDVAANFFKAIGIKKKEGCGCEKRQEWLNKVLPNPFLKKQNDLLQSDDGSEQD